MNLETFFICIGWSKKICRSLDLLKEIESKSNNKSAQAFFLILYEILFAPKKHKTLMNP